MIIGETKFRALNESDPQVVDKERGHGLQKKNTIDNHHQSERWRV